jgi:hypothetical protein
MQAIPGKINKNGTPNLITLVAGLKQCIVMIPVSSRSNEVTIEKHMKLNYVYNLLGAGGD